MPHPPRSESPQCSDALRQIADDVSEAGALLYALAAVADERGVSLTLRRSPKGALVVWCGEPEQYLAEDVDETEALRKAHAKLETWTA